MNNIDITKIKQQILSINSETLNLIDFNSRFKELLNFNGSYQILNIESGREHYRLLAHITTLFSNCVFFDVGTNACRSAISLSYNTSNKIKSYDVVQILEKNPQISNVEFLLGDAVNDSDFLNSSLIFLDVNHDGTYENYFYKKLIDINWKGILMLDDIHLNEPMREFWNSIGKEKYDLTSVGHWSGTGIVIFE
jgi:hypothetical protein